MTLRFERLSVLVVEDTGPMQKLLVAVLEALGVRNIQTCTNGEDAFRYFCQYNHDVILSDWQMEPMDGITLTRHIRMNALSPNRMVPVILITGYSALPRVEEARDAGVTEFLVKPFTANDLAKRLAHVINKPRDYIETQDFFGPDRRRRKDSELPDYSGARRTGWSCASRPCGRALPRWQSNKGSEHSWSSTNPPIVTGSSRRRNGFSKRSASAQSARMSLKQARPRSTATTSISCRWALRYCNG